MIKEFSGDKIRHVRHHLGLSRRKFAEELGLTGKNRQDTVGRMEQGKRSPKGKTLDRLIELSKDVPGIVALFLMLCLPIPAHAGNGTGVISICRLPYEHNRGAAIIPAGSLFRQFYTVKISRSDLPHSYDDVRGGYEVKTLVAAKIALPGACVAVPAEVHSGLMRRNAPPLATASNLRPEFEEINVMANLRAKVVDGFEQ